MKKLLIAIALAASSAAPADETTLCPDGAGPKSAVEGYGKNLRDHEFAAAYDFVTAKMTDGKPREEWAALQKKMFELGGVELGAADLRAPHTVGTAKDCATEAIVPNVLRAKDVLNNQGSTEFEIYTVVKTGERWQVDSQETLFDEPAIHKWFPGEKIPEFKETK
ncbi:MAG: hypothetical protein HY749_04585 [Gammaproteobacteria bacterium]|nr:hypothetical protein [Gammaproteobacteria bacterium]MBI5617612.1 hypothetical protein [Gammaproteobacteria bacterium]